MATDQNTIVGLYVIYFGRSPDPQGLQFWQSQPLDAFQIASAFSQTTEAQSGNPFLQAPTLGDPVQFLNSIYQASFGIDVNQEGIDFWVPLVNQITQSGAPLQEIYDALGALVLDIVSGAPPEFADVLQARANVALDYSNKGLAEGMVFTPATWAPSVNNIASIVPGEDIPTLEAAAKEANTADITAIVSGGGGGTQVSLLQTGAFVSGGGSNGVTPEGFELSSQNDSIQASVFLENSAILDPSTTDSDILTAVIVPGTLGANLVPAIENVETLNLTGGGGTLDFNGITGTQTVNLRGGTVTLINALEPVFNLVSGFGGQVTTSLVTSEFFSNGGNFAVFVNNGDFLLNVNPTEAETGTVINRLQLNSFEGVFTAVTPEGVESALTVQRVDNNGFDTTFDFSGLTGPLTFEADEFFNGFNTTTIIGTDSDDAFSFVASDNDLGPDISLDGGDGSDTVTAAFDGNFATSIDGLRNIETLVLVEFEDGGAVNLIPVDDVVAAGALLTVNGSALTADSPLTFDGVFETNGRFDLTGGAGDDTLFGGDRSDILTGGTGADFLVGRLGADIFNAGQGQSNAYIFASGNNIVDNGDTFSFVNAGGDILQSDFVGFGDFSATSDAISGYNAAIDVSDLFGAATNSTLNTANNYSIRGNYNFGTGVFTVNAAGASTMLLLGDGEALNGSTNTSSIILGGFTGTLTTGNFV